MTKVKAEGKLLKLRPVHLQSNLEKKRDLDSDLNDDYLDLQDLKITPILEQEQGNHLVEVLEQEPGEYVEQPKEPATNKNRKLNLKTMV